MPDPPGFVPDAPETAPAPTTPSPTRALSKATTIKAQPKPFSKQWFKEAGFRGTAATAEALPQVGGMVGGILGGGGGLLTGGTTSVPGAVGGAGLLGAGGEAARQLILRALGYPSPTTQEQAGKDILLQGLEQGGLQLGGEAISAVPGLLRGWGTGQYIRALAPTTMGTKATAREIVPQLIKRGEIGSVEGLEERAASKISSLGPKLDVAYAQTPASATVLPTGPLGMGVGSGTQILGDLDKLKQSYIVQGKIVDNAAVDAINGVQNVIKRQGTDIDPVSLRRIKQVFDEQINWGKEAAKAQGIDYVPTYTQKAQKVAADSIRRIVGQANPDVAALDKEIHFWYQVQDVTSYTSLRRVGQSGGLIKTLAAPLAAAAGIGGVGGSLGHGVEGGVIGAVGGTVATLATQMVRSDLWRTTSAVFKDRVANAIARGNMGELAMLAARIGIGGRTAYKQAKQPLPGQNQTQ